MRFVLVLAAFGLVAMLTVWQHVQSVQAGYDVSRLRRERDILAEENRRLELEADRLKSPENLLRWVEKHRPELKPARQDQVVRVRPAASAD